MRSVIFEADKQDTEFVRKFNSYKLQKDTIIGHVVKSDTANNSVVSAFNIRVLTMVNSFANLKPLLFSIKKGNNFLFLLLFLHFVYICPLWILTSRFRTKCYLTIHRMFVISTPGKIISETNKAVSHINNKKPDIFSSNKNVILV